MSLTADDRLTNLMFLLTVAPLATGCPGDDTTTSDTLVNPTTSGPATTGPADSSTGSMPATQTGSSGVGSGSTAADSSGVTTDEPTGGTTAGLVCDDPLPPVGEINQACIDYTTLSNECNYQGELSQECLDLYQAYCQYAIEFGEMTYGMGCAAAYVDYLACLSQLTCEEIGDEVDDCPDEEMALDTECM